MYKRQVATYAQDNVVDEVVWVVGDEAILKSDVEEARMDALYNGRRFEGDPYCVIPEEIAVQKLFLHQAKLDSIEVSRCCCPGRRCCTIVPGLLQMPDGKGRSN